MIDLATIGFIALLVVQAIGTIVYLVLLARFLSRLRDQCPAVYESLGSPSLIFNNTPKNNMLLLRWLLGRDYATLGDADIVRSAGLIRLMLVSLFCTFLALVVMFAVFGLAINAKAV